MRKILVGLGILLGLSGVCFAWTADPSTLSLKGSTQITSSETITTVGDWNAGGKYKTKTILVLNPATTGGAVSGNVIRTVTVEGSCDDSLWAVLDGTSIAMVGTGEAQTVTLENLLPYIRVRLGLGGSVGIVTPEVYGRFSTN